MRELIIDQEFKELIPPLTPDEYKQLEDSISDVGFESGRGKIMTWQGTIIDGHNRYEICNKHNINFETEEVSHVTTREEVVLWIVKNQLGRRNLSLEQMEYYRGKQYNMEKKLVTNENGKNQHTEVEGQNDPQPKKQNTAERIAEQHNVSPATIKRNAKKADAIDAIGDISPVAKYKILAGEVEIKSKDLEHMNDKFSDCINDVVQQIEEGIKKPKIEPVKSDIIDVDFKDVKVTNIIDTLKMSAESEYLLYRDTLDRAETDEERTDIIAKHLGFSGRSEYIKIERMIEIQEILKNKGTNHNYLDDYLNAKHHSNKISTLLATYIRAKTDIDEIIDPVNNPADENIIDEATQELDKITDSFHKAVSCFSNMDNLIENMDISSLKSIRQKMEWVLGAMDGFFNKANTVIGDGCTSPLSLEPIFNTLINNCNYTDDNVSSQQEPVNHEQKPIMNIDSTDTATTKQEIFEIDSFEIRAKMLQGNKEKIPLSKVYFLFQSDIPRRNFYRNLEQELGLCDKDDKILLSYEDYEMFITEYDPNKSNEPARTKTRIKKIKDSMKTA